MLAAIPGALPFELPIWPDVRNQILLQIASWLTFLAIFITPGYRFKAVDALMTNFHLPRSTLFMLVSAFSGLDMMRAAYTHAIESGYRFYSYGDAGLLFRERT